MQFTLQIGVILFNDAVTDDGTQCDAYIGNKGNDDVYHKITPKTGYVILTQNGKKQNSRTGTKRDKNEKKEIEDTGMATKEP